MPLPGAQANTLNPKSWWASMAMSLARLSLTFHPPGSISHTYSSGSCQGQLARPVTLSGHPPLSVGLCRLCWDLTHEGPRAKGGWRREGLWGWCPGRQDLQRMLSPQTRLFQENVRIQPWNPCPPKCPHPISVSHPFPINALILA